MKTKLDEINNKIDGLMAKKKKLEEQQDAKIIKLIRQKEKKGLSLESLLGIITKADTIITEDTKEDWHKAGATFLGKPKERRAQKN